jgi:uncharacterized protein DUF397
MNWIRSSYCSDNACVEAAVAENGDIVVRDSGDPNGPPLWFSPDEWQAFLDGAKAGEFDLQTVSAG